MLHKPYFDKIGNLRMFGVGNTPAQPQGMHDSPVPPLSLSQPNLHAKVLLLFFLSLGPSRVVEVCTKQGCPESTLWPSTGYLQLMSGQLCIYKYASKNEPWLDKDLHVK
jgi:hypothetical protein